MVYQPWNSKIADGISTAELKDRRWYTDRGAQRSRYRPRLLYLVEFLVVPVRVDGGELGHHAVVLPDPDDVQRGQARLLGRSVIACGVERRSVWYVTANTR